MGLLNLVVDGSLFILLSIFDSLVIWDIVQRNLLLLKCSFICRWMTKELLKKEKQQQ